MEPRQYCRTKKGKRWHLFLTFTRMIGGARTVCDLNATADSVTKEMPFQEDICGNCIRRAPVEVDDV